VHPSKAWTIGLAAAVWAAGSGVASAREPAGFRAPLAGDRLRAGEPLAVTWSVDADTLAGRDEMELVLSLDGGATFPIRVTGELSTDRRTLSWRVPSLATERAVLALRAGDDGEDESETILADSEPFAIVANPDAGPEPLYAVAHEWRTRDALDGAPVRTAPRDLAPSSGGPEVSAADGGAHESETPPAGGEVHQDESVSAIARAPARIRPLCPTHPPTSAPLPLRL
jgi:hypothetical protein